MSAKRRSSLDDCQAEARPGSDAVDQQSTGAANAVFAADVSSRQAELVTNKVAQQHTRLDVALVAHAVHPVTVTDCFAMGVLPDD